MTTLIAFALLAGGDSSFICPVMGNKADDGKVIYYAGFKSKICCGGCDSAFTKSPVKYLTEGASKGVVAEFMFDPISHGAPKASADIQTSTYKGVRYLFESAANKAAFDKTPAKFAVAFPSKEVLVCPIAGEEIASPKAAAGFADVKGVRYYVCCPGCLGKLMKDPAGSVAKLKDKVKPAAAGK